MSRIASIVLLTVAGFALAPTSFSAETSVKADAKKVASKSREIGREIGKGAKQLGKAVAATAKESAKAAKAGASQVKRNLAEE
jgi:hypothetical protein